MNHRGPLPLRELHSTDETRVWRDPRDLEPVYDLFTIISEITARGCDTDMWHLCKAGLLLLLLFILFLFFIFYGESPRTPPLEGTSLHRRNNSVERPWGILSLFTTCVFTITSVMALPETVTHATWPTTELIPHQGALDKMQQVVYVTAGLKK